MDGDHSDRESLTGLPLRSAARPHWRRASRHRIGPLRSVTDVGDHPVLRGIRSGAVTGLVIVAVLSLPVLLVLGAKAPAPARFEAPARVWAATPEADATVRAWAEPSPAPAIAPVTTALAAPVPVRAPSPAPSRDRARDDRPTLSVDLIPVLDDESGDLSVEEPPVPVVKQARPGRVPPPSRPARSP
ncbi:hypothetical protein [Methylobacterium sp.]|uniref:hypothetical protein n=1 Tax=Methylobacterium sp. TaxID=409 RepID=UPI0026297B77|nr:hypothetical protein [Methylobacterium sp.]MDB5647474.1 hypothetical protein [Methylobacterium sp.]